MSWKLPGYAERELTAGPAFVEVEHLVDQLDAGSSLPLRFPHNFGVSTLVRLH